MGRTAAKEGQSTANEQFAVLSATCLFTSSHQHSNSLFLLRLPALLRAVAANSSTLEGYESFLLFYSRALTDAFLT